MTSDLVLQTREPRRDVFLFKQKGLGSPYRMNEVGEVVRLNDKKVIWASSRQNLPSGVSEQKRCRPACASVQSDQRLYY